MSASGNRFPVTCKQLNVVCQGYSKSRKAQPWKGDTPGAYVGQVKKRVVVGGARCSRPTRETTKAPVPGGQAFVGGRL